MLKHVKVKPLGAESLGVRSMCTYVETADAKILLDAGVSLCPFRFGLPPHPLEFEAIKVCRRRIAEAAEKADFVTISHYHFDHHTPSFEDWLSQWTEADETAKQIYEGKTVWLKNPRENINHSQRLRGWIFGKTGAKHAKKTENADGRTFSIGKTSVKFSEPVFHGPENSALGKVLMTTIQYENEKFMFAPDVQGPISKYTLQLILKEKPHFLLLGGPPSYLAGFKVDEKQIQEGLDNLQKIVTQVPSVIVEHHILRDEKWRDWLAEASAVALKASHKVMTAAEFLGQKNSFLEASRQKLFAEHAPSKEFAAWMRKNGVAKRFVKPPV